MKKILRIVLSLALLVSAGAIFSTSAESADVVKQSFEVDFDEMTFILTDKGNDVGTTPFAMVAVSPDGMESPFSLAADANNGKKLQYNVTTADRNKAHYLDFYVAAAPYARIVMKANIKENGDPRPYFRLYDTALTTVQNDLWADQESADGKIYIFTFLLDATGTGVVRLNLGAYYLPGTRRTTDGSEAGTVELDDVTFDIEEYNELYTIGATDKLPTCLGYNNPVGLCIGSPFNGKYFSISEEDGSRIVHYKNDESKVNHSFIAIFDAGAVLTQDTEYTLNFDARVLETVKVRDIDLWIKMYACDAAGSMKYPLCPLGAAADSDLSKAQESENLSYDELGVMEGGKFSIAASKAWKCGLMENVAAPNDDTYFFSQSKYTEEYASLGIKFMVPAGIRYVRMDMRLSSSINNQFEKNEIFLRNILLEKNVVAEIIGADGWQEDLTSTVYNLVDADDAAATFANELAFNSKNNPVVGVALNGNALMAGVDYTIVNNKVKLAAAVQTEAAQENSVLVIRAANGNDYTFTVAELTSGDLWALSVREKGGDELIATFDPATRTYTVKSDVNAIVIDATAQMGDETVKINGREYVNNIADIALEDGANTIKVEVFKGTQLINTYTLTVNYTVPTTTPTTTPTATGTNASGSDTDKDTSPNTGVGYPIATIVIAIIAIASIAITALSYGIATASTKPRKK